MHRHRIEYYNSYMFLNHTILHATFEVQTVVPFNKMQSWHLHQRSESNAHIIQAYLFFLVDFLVVVEAGRDRS